MSAPNVALLTCLSQEPSYNAVLYRFAPNCSVTSVPSLSGDSVARPSWTRCAQLDVRPHRSREADPAFVQQEYATRQSRVAVLSLRLQSCAGASGLCESCRIWARGKGRPSKHSLDVGCWYSRYLARIVRGFLSVSRSSRRTQEVESRRVWLARRDHRSSSEELQASKREVWRSFLVGRAVLSENSIVWSLQQRRIKGCERGFRSSGTRCQL